MRRNILSTLFALGAILAALPAAGQETTAAQGVFRLDYTFVRIGPEGKIERHFSLLTTCKQQASIRESSRKPIGATNEWADVGVTLTARTHDAADGRLSLTSDLNLTEAETAAEGLAPRFTVSGSTTATVRLGEPVSLIRLESQDGLRRYELHLTATRADE